MIRRLLCWLGLHRWDPIITFAMEWDMLIFGNAFVRKKDLKFKCIHCGKER